MLSYLALLLGFKSKAPHVHAKIKAGRTSHPPLFSRLTYHMLGSCYCICSYPCLLPFPAYLATYLAQTCTSYAHDARFPFVPRCTVRFLYLIFLPALAVLPYSCCCIWIPMTLVLYVLYHAHIGTHTRSLAAPALTQPRFMVALYPTFLTHNHKCLQIWRHSFETFLLVFGFYFMASAASVLCRNAYRPEQRPYKQCPDNAAKPETLGKELAFVSDLVSQVLKQKWGAFTFGYRGHYHRSPDMENLFSRDLCIGYIPGKHF